jgi:hypothetical protein
MEVGLVDGMLLALPVRQILEAAAVPLVVPELLVQEVLA